MSVELMKSYISTIQLFFPEINTFKNNPKNNDRIPYIEKHSMIFVVKITDNLRISFYFGGSNESKVHYFEITQYTLPEEYKEYQKCYFFSMNDMITQFWFIYSAINIFDMYKKFIEKKFNKELVKDISKDSSIKKILENNILYQKKSYFYSIMPINGCIIYYPRFVEILNRFFPDVLRYDDKCFLLNNYYQPQTVIDNNATDYNKIILGIDLGYYIIIFMKKNRFGLNPNSIIFRDSKKIVKEYQFLVEEEFEKSLYSMCSYHLDSTSKYKINF
jgi:hypothetical protein